MVGTPPNHDGVGGGGTDRTERLEWPMLLRSATRFLLNSVPTPPLPSRPQGGHDEGLRLAVVFLARAIRSVGGGGGVEERATPPPTDRVARSPIQPRPHPSPPLAAPRRSPAAPGRVQTFT